MRMLLIKSLIQLVIVLYIHLLLKEVDVFYFLYYLNFFHSPKLRVMKQQKVLDMRFLLIIQQQHHKYDK